MHLFGVHNLTHVLQRSLQWYIAAYAIACCIRAHKTIWLHCIQEQSTINYNLWIHLEPCASRIDCMSKLVFQWPMVPQTHQTWCMSPEAVSCSWPFIKPDTTACGFVDGGRSYMAWWQHHKHMTWYCPGKANLPIQRSQRVANLPNSLEHNSFNELFW